MKNRFPIPVKLAIVIVIIISASCQKVVNIDLNSASPKVVIEGFVSDQPGPYIVKLTKTVNFSETNVFPPVTGAFVTISDNVGNVDTLKESLAGIYKTSTLQGMPGRTYTLVVNDEANSQTYTAVSTMPFPVNLDTIKNEHQGIFGNKQALYAVFPDPAGIANYYAIFTKVNSVSQNQFSSADDHLRDGDTIKMRIPLDLNSNDQSPLNPGDTLKVMLESIDKNVREYLRLLRQLNNQGGFQSAPPANPVTNITGGALGYFSAYAVRSKSVIIP